jgi:hypothetical protein
LLLCALWGNLLIFFSNLLNSYQNNQFLPLLKYLFMNSFRIGVIYFCLS